MADDVVPKVKAKYALVYPHWKNVAVEEIISTAADVTLVVVRADDESGVPIEPEICFVPHDSEAIVFGHTRDLAREIKKLLDRNWFDRLFSKAGISGIVMVVLLVALCVLAFLPGAESNSQIIQLLGAAFIGAVGFYFGTATQPKQ